jgi:hypothetical protein
VVHNGGALRPPRHNRGFERAGRLAPAELGLDLPRARELLLSHAWRSIAGELLAQRARPVKLQRGVLELRVEDSRWVESLVGLAPRLVGRLAGSYPELGVRRFRLCRPDGPPDRPQAVSPQRPAREPRPDPLPTRPPAAAPRTEPGERLERLMERYLARAQRPRS